MKYGWIPDLPDHRDRVFRMAPVDLPDVVDLRERSADGYAKVFDQGQLGSCTGNAVAAIVQYIDPGHFQEAPPSRLFIYYNARAAMDLQDKDSGASIREAIKSVNRFGVCAETLWPYRVDRYAEQPDPASYQAAELHQSIKYERLYSDLFSLKQCLANGVPFVFGATIHASFHQAAKTGVVPMPGDEPIEGGHALACFGYVETDQAFIVRNSWGTDWGKHGYCLMPFGYVSDLNLCDDHWAISLME